MPRDIFPQTTPELAARRKQLAPDTHDAFMNFSERVFAAGAFAVTPRPRCVRVPRLRRSWRQYGLPPKCARVAPTRIRLSRSIRLRRPRRNRKADICTAFGADTTTRRTIAFETRERVEDDPD